MKVYGLMGLKSDGTLVTPSGRNLLRLPLSVSSKIQNMQHKIAILSWKKNGLWFSGG